jgi:hypothetical protein
MNRKISVAVGAAAAVAFTGAAYASDLLTINQTSQYIDPNVSAAFIPHWLLPGGDCHAAPGGTSTVGCPDHGSALVGQAAGTEAENFWSSGDAIPQIVPNPAGSWALVAPTGDNPFMSGLFRTDGTSFFTGLSYACNTPGDTVNGCYGMGAPLASVGGAGFTAQQEWIDQTVIGYVQSNADTDGNLANGGEGDITLAQNMRSQFNMTGTSLTAVGSHIDQRLEQMVELNGLTGSNDNVGVQDANGVQDASRQTVQQAFGVNATSSGNPTADGGGGHFMLGQLVAQDVQGFLFSCMNCNSSGNDDEHAVTPSLLDVRYQPYVGGWDSVPTIVHGGQ